MPADHRSREYQLMSNLTSQRDITSGRQFGDSERMAEKGEPLVGMVVRRTPSSGTQLSWLLWGGLLAAMAPSAHSQVVTQYGYDAGDHIRQVTDPRGLLTTYAFDGLGQKWQQVSPDTGTTSLSYDGYGRIASMTRADGSQTTYGYDGISRRTSMSAGGLTQTFTYDACTNGI